MIKTKLATYLLAFHLIIAYNCFGQEVKVGDFYRLKVPISLTLTNVDGIIKADTVEKLAVRNTRVQIVKVMDSACVVKCYHRKMRNKSRKEVLRFTLRSRRQKPDFFLIPKDEFIEKTKKIEPNPRITDRPDKIYDEIETRIGLTQDSLPKAKPYKIEDFQQLEDSLNDQITIMRERYIVDSIRLKELTNSLTSQSAETEEGQVLQVGIQLKTSRQNYFHLRKDSARLQSVVMGKQRLELGQFTLYRNFAEIRDDYNANITQFHFNQSFPIWRKNGLIDNRKNHCRWVLVRNVAINVVGTLKTDRIFGARDTLLDPEHPDSISSPNREPYVNELDLVQFNTLRFGVKLNLITLISPDYNVYLDFYYNFARTPVYNAEDSVNNINFGFGGLSISARTKWDKPFNFIGSVYFYDIDPNTQTVRPLLNPQYHKLSQYLNDKLILDQNHKSIYVDTRITLQYHVGKKEGGDSDQGSSGKSGSSSFIYAMFSYNTIFLFKKPYSTRDNNNFFMAQLGYSLDLQKIVDATKKLF